MSGALRGRPSAYGHGAWVLMSALTFCLACETEIRIENAVPNATLKDVRWVTENNSYTLEDDESLAPGETSAPIRVHERDYNAGGRIQFALVIDGKMVALETEHDYTAKSGQTTTFTISPATAATNPLAK